MPSNFRFAVKVSKTITHEAKLVQTAPLLDTFLADVAGLGTRLEGNQPLRLVEYPPRFRETLEALPRQAARGALAMIGQLAGGDPAAFVGVVQLKACHGVLRQRVGSEHRLLFRLLPESVQVVDFINRRDLNRTIKALRAVGV